MSRASSRRRALIGAIMCAAVVGTAQPAVASTVADGGRRHPAAPHSSVHGVEKAVARSLASSLARSDWRARVRAATLATEDADLQALTDKDGSLAGKALPASVAGANRRVAALKGLPASTGSLLRVRLGAASMRTRLTPDMTPWVAVAASDEHAKTITAYDSRGRGHTVDATHVPAFPLYVLDIDAAKAHKAGLRVLHEQLADNGVSTPAAQGAHAADTAGWWATKVTAVEVNDDQEPWFKGAAEMFSLVTGFGQDGKARVDSVDMPYLDYDGTVYSPNQILVNWSNYKYNLADVVMMEDDDGTNYKSLAQALTTALLTVTDQGTYIPLVNAVLSAMPDSWFTDDPDYVESWYTLARNSTGRLNGAAGNGWMTVEPYFVEQF
ncbi:DUF3103 family protein [Streptomyces collinus]|uniref:DUF3103 family protein n=1 Tax=Streptomyces collinus TaxID=42684 RepID=UPI00294306BB|nr:DUF3103 family protein [Streptomyces collinus]